MSLPTQQLGRSVPSLAVCAALAAACAGQIYAQEPVPGLAIHGLGTASVTLTAADLARLPNKTITVTSEKGQPAQYRCAIVADVLTSVGADMGPAIRDKRFLETVQASARDGYEVVFSLPELDPAFTETPARLCFEKNGAALPSDEGPLRLVLEKELRHGRWVRQLSALTWVR